MVEGEAVRTLGALPGRLYRLAVSTFALGGASRVEIWNMLADLMVAGLDVERALLVTAKSFRDQGQTVRARVVERWFDALKENRLAAEIALWVPATEAMVLRGYGGPDASRLFAAAARIAETRGKQKAALWSALGMPCALAAGIALSLWLAGGQFIPVMAEVAPPERWEVWTRMFAEAALWVHRNDTGLAAGVAAGVAALLWLTLNWSGPGRTWLDGVAPFSLYRTVAGAAFLMAVIEFLRAGVDINERTFALLKESASRYTRSRIGAIERGMKEGLGLGAAMARSGHGFPDPSLVAVVAALERTRGWESKLSAFVARWSMRSEELLRRRAAVLNAVLLVVAAVMMGVAIKGMFGMMSAATAGMG